MIKTKDFIVVSILFILLMTTMYFLVGEQPMEVKSMNDRITAIEDRLNKLRPVPRLQIEHATVYTAEGEIVIEGEIKRENRK